VSFRFIMAERSKRRDTKFTKVRRTSFEPFDRFELFVTRF